MLFFMLYVCGYGSHNGYFFRLLLYVGFMTFNICFKENAAICDDISHTQQKLLVAREECKFLMKKLKPFEPNFGKYSTFINIYY